MAVNALRKMDEPDLELMQDGYMKEYVFLNFKPVLSNALYCYKKFIDKPEHLQEEGIPSQIEVMIILDVIDDCDRMEVYIADCTHGIYRNYGVWSFSMETIRVSIDEEFQRLKEVYQS
jgi:hypothetical protein